MAPDQRGEVGDVVVADVHSVQSDLANGFLHVDGVPMHDGIESQAKSAKLLFLSLLEWAPDFTAFAAMNAPSEAMAQLRVVELGENAPSERRVVDVVEDVDCLGDPADFGERARQCGRLISHLKGPHDARRLEVSEFQRTGEADDIGPIVSDQCEVDGAFAKAVERAVIGFAIDPPQLDVAEVGQARAELIAEQPEDAEYRIGVCSGVGHEFGRLQLGFLFEEQREQHQAVAQGAGDHDAVEAAELVGHQIVPSHAARLAEILRVRPGMDGARRRGEAHAVRRGDIASAPDFDERQCCVGGHDQRTGGRDGFRPDEVLADPCQAFPPECGHVLPADGLDADIAGLRDQGGAQAGLEMLYPGLPAYNSAIQLLEAHARLLRHRNSLL